MRCPFCQYLESKVIDSRPSDEHKVIRRRRECIRCTRRFTTYEKVESLEILVIKKNEDREIFDEEKLKRGIIRACQKRPINIENIEEILKYVENEINSFGYEEIETVKIGELVLKKLKEIDEVAYIRFASVYRDFKNIDTFMLELEKLKSEK